MQPSWFLILFIVCNNIGQNLADDEYSVAKWILALDPPAPDLGSFSESSSSSEEDSISSLESREPRSGNESDDVSQDVAADDPTARIFIPDIEKVKTIVDILKTVGSVVVPIIIEGIEGVAGGVAQPVGEIQDRLPKDVVTFRSRGVMLLRNAKMGLDGST